MTIAVGAHVSALGAGATTTTATRTSTGGAGTVFAVFVAWYAQNAGDEPSAVTGQLNGSSDGNTYTQVGATYAYSVDNLLKCALFECVAGAGGALHTFAVTFGTAPWATSIWAVELVGGATSSIRDQAPAGTEDLTSPYTSAAATTTQASELLLTFAATLTLTGTETITWGDSFASTGDDLTDPAAGICGSAATRIVSSTGTYSASFTASGAGTYGALQFLITYKDAAAVVSTSGESPQRRLLRSSAVYRM